MVVSSKTGRLRLIAALVLVASMLASGFGLTWGMQATGVQAAAPMVKAPAANRPNISADMVISQVYGGGGNGGATYTNDFIELFNRSTAPVTMNNWSVQYASATGSSWQVSVLTGTITVQPGQYFLIQEAAGAGGTQALPPPDNIGAIAMSGTAGKVALVNNSTGLTGTCPIPSASVVDFVGFGGTASCFEGTGPTTAPSNSTSVVRNSAGCTDTDNNAADFTAVAPTPRNSSSPANLCGPVNTSTVTSTASSTITPGGPTLTPTGTATQTATATATATIDPNATHIRDIQGLTHISPLNGQTVTGVVGIVTAKKSNAFYMQDPNPDANDATDEGIVVFTGAGGIAAVNVGDKVSVGGTVQEFRLNDPVGASNLTTTEIGSPTVTVLSTGNALPTPVVLHYTGTPGPGVRIVPTQVIEDDATGDVENPATAGTFDPATDGLDLYESLEGMLVQVNNPVAVAPGKTFEEIPVLADDGAGAGVRTARGGIIIRPTDFNPERITLDGGLPGVTIPNNNNVGDHFSGVAVGVMDYDFGEYKLFVKNSLTLVSSGLQREVTTPAAVNEISIGNFNVQNLAPSNPQSKFDALASLIGTNLKAPDLLSIEEIQDNTGATDDGVVAADQTWNKLITTISNTSSISYTYRQIDPVNDQDGGQPGGNIRQGFLFRTDRGLSFIDRPGATSVTTGTVSNVGGTPQLNFSPVRIAPNDPAWGSSRKPLVGEFMYNGKKIFVIGNHFASKGGDDPLYGHVQPPIRSSEVKRHRQAQLVHDFVQQILNIDPNANVVVTGDLNDFQFSDTITILKSGSTATPTPSPILTTLIDALPLNEQYTYDYQGNAQAIDLTLTSAHMLTYLTLYDVVHVNSEFYDQQSDHDPQVAHFSIPAGGVTVTVTATAATTGTTTATVSATTVGTSTGTAVMTASTTGTSTVGTSTQTRTATVVGTTTGTQTSTVVGTSTTTRTSTTQPTSTGTATAVSTATRTLTVTAVSTATRTATAGATATCTSGGPIVVNGSIDPTDPTASARLFRDGVASTCAAPKAACPGTFTGAPPYHYDSYTYTNTSGSSQCVTVALASAANIQAVTYLGSFDPANICTNYLADPGLSTGTGGTVTASFTLAAGATFVQVVNDPNGNTGTGGAYTLTITGLPGAPCTTGTVTTTPQTTSTTTTTRTSTAVSTGTGTSTSVATGTGTSVATTTRTSTAVATGTGTSVATGTSIGTGTVGSTITAVATFTPAATNTAGPSATSTTVPPTACPIQFQDVLSDNTFYPYVRCLACRGILGGYPCGGTGEPCGTTNNPYFRPGVSISRGQIAKIVSQSAGFNEAPGTQIYEDVPMASPFYQYINRLSNRGYIGGYPCGQLPSETCITPNNRPYFRPSSNATRGQLSKIVATAAMITDPVSGQIYTDVGTDSPFYKWIQQLSARGVMSGYPCGGAGEPCDSQNRPYFRPSADVTRGQASKIVANTFFPNCNTPANAARP